MEENKLVKFDGEALQRVGNAIAITDKLLKTPPKELEIGQSLSETQKELAMLKAIQKFKKEQLLKQNPNKEGHASELVPIYKSVKIGNQEWMTENLNVDCYRNGDPIPYMQDLWEGLTTGALCDYEDNPENGTKYG